MSDGELPPSATVTYEFRDSSVPPPFHRSFVLVFDRSQARIVVDSYGDILAEQATPMTPEAWDRVAEGYPGVREIPGPEEPVHPRAVIRRLRLAAAALREAVKLIPPGGVEAAGFFTGAAKTYAQAHPDRFSTAELNRYADAIDAHADQWQRR